MKKILLLILILSIATSSFAAMRSAKVTKNNKSAPTPAQELTLGTVQKYVQTGTTQSAVVKVLGSPNIVTRDAYGKDTWIYDKMSSSESYNENSNYSNFIFIGHRKARANVEDVQKTLTVVIKFNDNYKVDSYTYYMSQF